MTTESVSNDNFDANKQIVTNPFLDIDDSEKFTFIYTSDLAKNQVALQRIYEAILAYTIANGLDEDLETPSDMQKNLADNQEKWAEFQTKVLDPLQKIMLEVGKCESAEQYWGVTKKLLNYLQPTSYLPDSFKAAYDAITPNLLAKLNTLAGINTETVDDDTLVEKFTNEDYASVALLLSGTTTAMKLVERDKVDENGVTITDENDEAITEVVLQRVTVSVPEAIDLFVEDWKRRQLSSDDVVNKTWDLLTTTDTQLTLVPMFDNGTIRVDANGVQVYTTDTRSLITYNNVLMWYGKDLEDEVKDKVGDELEALLTRDDLLAFIEANESNDSLFKVALDNPEAFTELESYVMQALAGLVTQTSYTAEVRDYGANYSSVYYGGEKTYTDSSYTTSTRTVNGSPITIDDIKTLFSNLSAAAKDDLGDSLLSATVSNASITTANLRALLEAAKRMKLYAFALDNPTAFTGEADDIRKALGNEVIDTSSTITIDNIKTLFNALSTEAQNSLISKLLDYYSEDDLVSLIGGNLFEAALDNSTAFSGLTGNITTAFKNTMEAATLAISEISAIYSVTGTNALSDTLKTDINTALLNSITAANLRALIELGGRNLFDEALKNSTAFTGLAGNTTTVFKNTMEAATLAISEISTIYNTLSDTTLKTALSTTLLNSITAANLKTLIELGGRNLFDEALNDTAFTELGTDITTAFNSTMGATSLTISEVKTVYDASSAALKTDLNKRFFDSLSAEEKTAQKDWTAQNAFEKALASSAGFESKIRDALAISQISAIYNTTGANALPAALKTDLNRSFFDSLNATEKAAHADWTAQDAFEKALASSAGFESKIKEALTGVANTVGEIQAVYNAASTTVKTSLATNLYAAISSDKNKLKKLLEAARGTTLYAFALNNSTAFTDLPSKIKSALTGAADTVSEIQAVYNAASAAVKTSLANNLYAAISSDKNKLKALLEAARETTLYAFALNNSDAFTDLPSKIKSALTGAADTVSEIQAVYNAASTTIKTSLANNLKGILKKGELHDLFKAKTGNNLYSYTLDNGTNDQKTLARTALKDELHSADAITVANINTMFNSITDNAKIKLGDKLLALVSREDMQDLIEIDGKTLYDVALNYPTAFTNEEAFLRKALSDSLNDANSGITIANVSAMYDQIRAAVDTELQRQIANEEEHYALTGNARDYWEDHVGTWHWDWTMERIWDEAAWETWKKSHAEYTGNRFYFSSDVTVDDRLRALDNALFNLGGSTALLTKDKLRALLESDIVPLFEASELDLAATTTMLNTAMEKSSIVDSISNIAKAASSSITSAQDFLNATPSSTRPDLMLEAINALKAAYTNHDSTAYAEAVEALTPLIVEYQRDSTALNSMLNMAESLVAAVDAALILFTGTEMADLKAQAISAVGKVESQSLTNSANGLWTNSTKTTQQNTINNANTSIANMRTALNDVSSSLTSTGALVPADVIALMEELFKINATTLASNVSGVTTMAANDAKTATEIVNTVRTKIESMTHENDPSLFAFALKHADDTPPIVRYSAQAITTLTTENGAIMLAFNSATNMDGSADNKAAELSVRRSYVKFFEDMSTSMDTIPNPAGDPDEESIKTDARAYTARVGSYKNVISEISGSTVSIENLTAMDGNKYAVKKILEEIEKWAKENKGDVDAAHAANPNGSRVDTIKTALSDMIAEELAGMQSVRNKIAYYTEVLKNPGDAQSLLNLALMFNPFDGQGAKLASITKNANGTYTAVAEAGNATSNISMATATENLNIPHFALAMCYEKSLLAKEFINMQIEAIERNTDLIGENSKMMQYGNWAYKTASDKFKGSGWGSRSYLGTCEDVGVNFTEFRAYLTNECKYTGMIGYENDGELAPSHYNSEGSYRLATFSGFENIDPIEERQLTGISNAVEALTMHGDELSNKGREMNSKLENYTQAHGSFLNAASELCQSTGEVFKNITTNIRNN